MLSAAGEAEEGTENLCSSQGEVFQGLKRTRKQAVDLGETRKDHKAL